MTLIINGRACDISVERLAEVLECLGYSTAVATAVNGEFVPRSARPTLRLREGDRLEVLVPMQGG